MSARSRISPVAWAAFALLCVVCLVFMPGCGTTPQGEPARVQRLLDQALPRSFRGDARVHHKNPWIDFTIVATDLRYEGGAWVWTSLKYERSDRFTNGEVTLGEAKRP